MSNKAAAEAADDSCRSCGHHGLQAFYSVDDVPTQTCVLLDSSAKARSFPTGDVLLAFCESCGFIQNVRFDPDLVDYSKPTEESQAFSPTFQRFANGLADDLVERYDLLGRSVLEVGCGKGDFLVLLAERGIASGVGIDPGFLPNRPEAAADVLHFIRDEYGRDSAELEADLVLTRHLMEHVPNTNEFFGWLTESVRATEDSALFTEVPDTGRVLDDGAFWDIYYEHCSYFTLGSLARALAASGLVIDFMAKGFDDQYILCGARPDTGGAVAVPNDAALLGEKVIHFAAQATAGVQSWRRTIHDHQRKGDTVAIWGGGSKAVAFLAAIGIDDVAIVDINPHKQGKWLPSVATQVQHPEALIELRPSLVIPMNEIYVEEITKDLVQMDLQTEVRPL